MGMTYKSSNGLTGVFEKGNFFGYKHYDLTVFETDTKQFIFHATYTEPITFEDLKAEVDKLPEFLERLRNYERTRENKKGDSDVLSNK